MLELYKNIRKRRIELDMTQEELAKKTNYSSKSAIARIEKGDIDLTVTKIKNFAQALRTTPSELMGEKDFEEAIVLDAIETADLIKKIQPFVCCKQKSCIFFNRQSFRGSINRIKSFN